MSIRGEYWWLRIHAGGVDWAHCHTGEGVPRQEGTAAAPADVPAPPGARIVLCVPGERARMHTVTMPRAGRKRMLAALPYALEDRLLHDVDSFHLVPTPVAARTSHTAVIVIEHAWLSSLLEQCTSAGWVPVLMLPDYLFLPEPGPSAWLLDATESPLLLRKPGNEGAALAAELAEQPPGMLSLALARAGDGLRSLRVSVADRTQLQKVQAWSAQLSGRNIELEFGLEQMPRSHRMARQPLPDPRLNMLVGPYAVRQTQANGLQRARLSLALTAALLLVWAAGWFIEGMRLQDEHSQLRSAIESVYRQAFPDSRNLVDPRFQMEQQLLALRNSGADAGNNGDFIRRLDSLASILATIADCRLLQIGYDGSTIVLDISVADYETLERLQEQLARAGKVSVENAGLKEGRVSGRLRIGGQA